MDVMNELFNDLQRVQHEETITPMEEVGWTDQPVVVVSPHEKPQETEEFVDPAILPLQETKEQEVCADRIEPVPKSAEETPRGFRGVDGDTRGYSVSRHTYLLQSPC